MNEQNFDLIVVGGGHAGIEAAWAAAQFPLQVAIVTMPGVGLASTPCNPAIGGVGKGQVVREIDAMGGLMGRLADLAGIQYRTLNESKGYAVQSTRIQVDKEVYSSLAQKIIEEKENITIVWGKISTVQSLKEEFCLNTEDGRNFKAEKIVVTTGTFLGGVLHTGKNKKMGGRVGKASSLGMADIFAGVKKCSVRFKTGTPPRLYKDKIEFSSLVEQKSCPYTANFHYGHNSTERFLPQKSCFLTHTNEKTLEIVRRNKEASPIFNGQITGIGPRYCPSIEDKAFRYPDRDKHHIFLEPEGLNLETIYPNGISTSLPLKVQQEFLATIKGLEKCEVAIPGYAVEYDVVDTLFLDETLESKDVKGLYFAGQVNGTSGYEEAAGQGLVAGFNSALSLQGKRTLVFNRQDSYIGVMIEDLVQCRRDEPYRLFTARSENRLHIREDNTALRMAPYRRSLGLSASIDRYNEEFIKSFANLLCECKKIKFNGKDMEKYFADMGYGSFRPSLTCKDILKRSEIDPVETLGKEIARVGLNFKPEVIKAAAITIKYQDYIERAKRENEKIIRIGEKKIHWEQIVGDNNLSNECRQRVAKYRPKTFAQLQKIEGIRPSTVAAVLGQIS